MKRSALLLGLVAAALCAASARSQTSPEALELVLPQNKQRIRIEIAVAGESPAAKWHAFLDRWFDYFDADSDGVLSWNEASRIFALPLPARRSVLFDFAKADADHDNKVSRAELKAFYRSAGFVPLLGVVQPASLENLQFADALFRHLGPDPSGKLTAENFKRAASLLRKLDENEDEVLTTAEVLSLGVNPALKAATEADFQWALPENKPAGASIRLILDDAAKPTLRAVPTGKSLRADPLTSAPRIRHEQAVLAFAAADSGPAKAAATSSQFVLAQFHNVAGKSATVEKRQVVDDPSLQLLADVFPHADRNQDGKLTLAELERFLALIEHGVNCRLTIQLADCGRNLFFHLDQNADGRLDLRELNAAANQIAALGGANGWTRKQVPHYLQVTLQRGFAGDAFGPLPLATPANASRAAVAARSAKGPAWFQAMDKNGDGFVSPREFLGPPELFRQLDRNGDGLISVAEAELADAKRPAAPLKN
jgi:Ca2+-binding EF-hand superfamily protein